MRKVMALVLAVVAAASLVGCSGGSSHTAYVTLTGTDQVAGYYVNNDSGSLSSMPGSPFAAGLGPSSIYVHPSKKFVYVANSGEATISLFTVSKKNGGLVEVLPRTATGAQPESLVIDSAGQFLFVGCVGSNAIIVYSINNSSGALSQSFGPLLASTPAVLKVSPSGKALYAANANSSTISAYSTGSGGSLTAVQGSPFGVGQGPSSIAIDPTGKFLYVTNLLAGSFSGFTIDPNSGALTPMLGSPFTPGTQPVSAAVDLSGKYLYIADVAGSEIFAYSLDPSTGIPTAVTGSPFKAGSAPVFVLVDSSGKFVFAGNESSNSISGFVIDPSSGALTKPTQFSTGSAPTSMFSVP